MNKRITFTVVMLLLTASTGLASLTDGLVAYYPFDGDASDLSGNANHGTVYGAQLTEDRFGIDDHAYLFDGQTDKIEAPHSASLDITGPITLSAWIRTNETYWYSSIIAKKVEPDPAIGYDLCTFDSKAATGLLYTSGHTHNGGIVFSDTLVVDGQWHLLTSTYDGSEMRMYVDGQLDGSLAYSDGYESNTEPLKIGYYYYPYNDGQGGSHNRALNGVIDEVRIYNRALTQSEITELYNEESGSEQFLLCSSEINCLTNLAAAIPLFGIPFDYLKYVSDVCQIAQLLEDGPEKREREKDALGKLVITLIKLIPDLLEELLPVQVLDIITAAMECTGDDIWEILDEQCGEPPWSPWSCIKGKWPELVASLRALPERIIAIITLSPVDIRVFDSQGNVMELNTEGYTDNSLSSPGWIFKGPDHQEFALILDADDTYQYELVGTDEGTYRLGIISMSGSEETVFEAFDIPTSSGARHVYAVNWTALSAGDEDAVVLEIDADGDGVPEKTVIADKDLTSEEFALQTETVIDFKPDTLNLRSPGKVVTAYIELPEGFNVSDIVISSLELKSSVSALSKPVKIGDYDEDGIPDLMVKFDRQQVAAVLEEGVHTVHLSGQLADETLFAGMDIIRVIGSIDAEAAAPEFESTMPEEFIADLEENLQTTVDIGGEDAFGVKEAVGFMLFEADGIIGKLGPESFNNEESAFELACVINDVFTMLDEGMYFEVMVILQGDILERMDGCANIGVPDEDDWITSIEGQVLLYPLVVETIELLESLL